LILTSAKRPDAGAFFAFEKAVRVNHSGQTDVEEGAHPLRVILKGQQLVRRVHRRPATVVMTSF